MKPLVLILLAASAGPHTMRKDLKAPREFQGWPCAAGYAWFFADGKLESCTLSREIPVGEITAPEKSWIALSEEGAPRFVWLPADAMVKGYPSRGGAAEHSYSIALYPSGKLKTLWLSADTAIDGVPCMKAGFIADVFGGGAETDFHENGKLKSCTLSADVTLRGHPYRRGDRIRLNAEGSVY
jgi:hypothetical protein